MNYVQLFLMRPELTMMLRWRMAHDRNFCRSRADWRKRKLNIPEVSGQIERGGPRSR